MAVSNDVVNLQESVANVKSVISKAIEVISGIGARIQAAVEAAGGSGQVDLDAVRVATKDLDEASKSLQAALDEPVLAQNQVAFNQARAGEDNPKNFANPAKEPNQQVLNQQADQAYAEQAVKDKDKNKNRF